MLNILMKSAKRRRDIKNSQNNQEEIKQIDFLLLKKDA